MKILWIGSINWFDGKNYVVYPHTAGAVSSSAFEQAIIEGLEGWGHKVRILSDWDNDAGKRFEWSHNHEQRDITVPGISIKYVRLFYKAWAMRRELERNEFLLKNVDVTVIYSVHVPYFSLLRKIKRINANCKIILVCPDLSEYMDPSIKKKPLKRMLRKLESLYIHCQAREIDGVIWFAEKMKEILPITAPSIVIEGVFSLSNIDAEDAKEEKRCVAYAGSLNSNFGIQNIIRAFEKLQDIDLELWIFGTGEMENELKQICSHHHRVKFFGFVDRHSLFEYEKTAMLLINARDPKEEYTKYSFPSKMFEYMASGTPVITTRLEGIPDEYYQYVVTMENNSVETIERTIRHCYSLSPQQRHSFGCKAKSFILNEKNSQEQSRRVSVFLEEVVKKC